MRQSKLTSVHPHRLVLLVLSMVMPLGHSAVHYTSSFGKCCTPLRALQTTHGYDFSSVIDRTGQIATRDCMLMAWLDALAQSTSISLCQCSRGLSGCVAQWPCQSFSCCVVQ